MNPRIRFALASSLVLVVGASAYLAGRHSVPPASSPSVPAERKILYYRNPMGLADTSPVPKKDSMGMDYIPVYADEKPAQTEGKGAILYYRNPMGLPDTSPVPKQDSMGMDYIPVYASETLGPGQLRISTDKMQKLGVRTAVAEERPFSRTVQAPGRIEIDERSVSVVAPRFEGWIERLHVNATGQNVSRGQPLFEVYSPDIYAAEQEYQLAVQGTRLLQNAGEEARRSMAALPQTSLRRLELLGVPAAEIRRLAAGGEPRRTFTVTAPASGTVMEKTAVTGARFMPGEPLFRIADLSRVWLQIDVPESALPLARPGLPLAVMLDAWPGERLNGRVEFVYPTLNNETRTGRLRVVLPNAGGRLKPGMYARAELQQQGGTQLAVPESAVIDSGRRQVVLVALSEGLFEARPVQTGERGDGWISIRSGLAAGERVVVSANFLIDAESNLQAALATLSQAPAPDAAAPPSGPAPAAPMDHSGHDAGQHEGH